MKVKFKNNLKKEIEFDLRRPCDYSYERVGFVFGIEREGLIEFDEYMPVDDQDYIPSDTHGAVFDKNAIKKALKKILKTKKSCFQIHEHSPLFGPGFSKADRETSFELCRAFNNFNEQAIHGSIIVCGEELNLMFIDTDCIFKETLVKEEI